MQQNRHRKYAPMINKGRQRVRDRMTEDQALRIFLQALRVTGHLAESFSDEMLKEPGFLQLIADISGLHEALVKAGIYLVDEEEVNEGLRGLRD